MMDAWLNSSEAILALAPMQDVTDPPFWRLMVRYGGADVPFPLKPQSRQIIMGSAIKAKKHYAQF